MADLERELARHKRDLRRALAEIARLRQVADSVPALQNRIAQLEAQRDAAESSGAELEMTEIDRIGELQEARIQRDMAELERDQIRLERDEARAQREALRAERDQLRSELGAIREPHGVVREKESGNDELLEGPR